MREVRNVIGGDQRHMRLEILLVCMVLMGNVLKPAPSRGSSQNLLDPGIGKSILFGRTTACSIRSLAST